MENLIVWIIVAGAFVFTIRGFIKSYKGDGGCGCSGSCSGCVGRDRDPHESCDPDKAFLHK